MSADSSSSIASDTTHHPHRRGSPHVAPRHRTLHGFVAAVAQG